jgi:N-formylmaleamate deformylase
MRDWPQLRIDVNGRSLRYFRSGGSRPPLVLVHGFTDNALYYSRLASELQSDWDVIAYDCRGHGHSDRANGDFSANDRASDLLGLISALGLTRPVVIGHSMGGSTIGTAFTIEPRFCCAAVLEDPAWWEAPPNDSAADKEARRAGWKTRNEAWKQSIAALQSGTFEDGLAIRRAEEPDWSESDVLLSFAARLEVELDLFTYFPPEEAEWHTAIQCAQSPMLIVLGERKHGALISREMADEAASMNPHVSWRQVEDAGHAIRYDHPEAFLREVKDFLAPLLVAPTP